LCLHVVLLMGKLKMLIFRLSFLFTDYKNKSAVTFGFSLCRVSMKNSTSPMYTYNPNPPQPDRLQAMLRLPPRFQCFDGRLSSTVGYQ
jgi:hypothetical protein